MFVPEWLLMIMSVCTFIVLCEIAVIVYLAFFLKLHSEYEDN